MAVKQNNCAICAGTFDPPSFGHINIIERALKVFDCITIAIALDNAKGCLFSFEERKAVFSEIFKDEPRVKIDSFRGLLVEYARQKGINVLVRGIRTVADYEYELQMSLANRMLNSNIETIFIMTEGRYSHISSSIVKQIIKLGGSGRDMIHPCVEEKLKEKLFPKSK
ncbi:MAG: pantetheine-phosphate adenylyltransferase [Deltaproteobacteria bacterium]|nr:pantetheine-phosphate adenylyltransferase [Deltaproteobacteria bacterium]